jgi:hypothetical protein
MAAGAICTFGTNAKHDVPLGELIRVNKGYASVGPSSPGKCFAAGSVAKNYEFHVDIWPLVRITYFGLERWRFDIFPILGLHSSGLEYRLRGLFVGHHWLESWRCLSKKDPHDCYSRVPDRSQVVATL